MQTASKAGSVSRGAAAAIEYTCSKGHWMAVREERTDCLAYVHGKQCQGELKRIGKGSRKAKK